MNFGFAKTDVTPRVGVPLAGFGPFRNRQSIGIRDRLWARAMAVQDGDRVAIVVSCDLLGLELQQTRRIRELVEETTGVPPEHVLVHCTHTHSGPDTSNFIGWGGRDAPFMEILPHRIARACTEAVADLSEGQLCHAEVPCEGIGLNRVYDRDAPPLEEVLQEDWRPAKPELTDTTCHVLTIRRNGTLRGFLAYFGCHPVVCCAETRYIHGDYAGVAMNLLERETAGAVGLFLQGAQGDVNTCVVHKPEQESLLALDVIASRFARRVRSGLQSAQPIRSDPLRCEVRTPVFSRRTFSVVELRELLATHEATFAVPGATDEDRDLRMSTVYAVALRRMIDRMERGEDLQPATEIGGLRIGDVVLLGAPFEVFQEIKNEVRDAASTPVTLVMGLTNDYLGYAPDRTDSARQSYASSTVPMIHGDLPFADIANELPRELLALEQALRLE